MFDSASFYENEDLVGAALHELIEVDKVVKREDMFIISKAWWNELEDVEAACRRSLKDLGLDYLDLYLVHWPVAVEKICGEDGQETYKKVNLPMHKVWAQMEALVDKGLVKSIGVSNFNV